MEGFYAFASGSPVLTVFLFLICGSVAGVMARLCVSLPNRIMRHWNINKHGYPPPHCDADGDFKQNII
jgi:hypothetical protein